MPRSVNSFIVHTIVWTVLTLVAAEVIGACIFLLTWVNGDDAWPGGVCLGVLLLYCLSMFIRYYTEQKEDREQRLEDEERYIEFY